MKEVDYLELTMGSFTSRKQPNYFRHFLEIETLNCTSYIQPNNTL